jgi:alkanesulfonate monooxygenase SsuD/methylene tetrahydromethanopterin reductase-like flavin-dependent oxidoreductase (luciferase family)
LLLPLRPTAMVAEEVAWLSARHPGRVGVGVAAGALAADFDAMGLPIAEAVPRFRTELPRLVAMLRGDDLGGLANDPALRACGGSPVTVLSAAVSTAAARRAAASGAGLVLEGMSTTERLAAVCAAYADAGGTQPVVLIRRVRLGAVRADLVEQQRQVYASYASGAHVRGDDQTATTDDPGELAEQLHAALRETGASALNLRVHLPGLPREDVREQIAALGQDVLPRVRALLAGDARTVADVGS